MERIITETPEEWVILKIMNEYYKVFAKVPSREGWRINSGIEKVEQDNDFYYFFGYSGSCYKCNKKNYGINDQNTLDVLAKIIKMTNGEIELLENVSDWLIINNIKRK